MLYVFLEVHFVHRISLACTQHVVINMQGIDSSSSCRTKMIKSTLLELGGVIALVKYKYQFNSEKWQTMEFKFKYGSLVGLRLKSILISVFFSISSLVQYK